MRISDWSSDVCSSDLPEWEAFIDEVIAPAFPAGFTTWPAQGAWRDASGRTIREASHVLAVVHPAGDTTSDTAIATVIAAYRTRFAQEAVLRTSTATRTEERRVGKEGGSTCRVRWSR